MESDTTTAHSLQLGDCIVVMHRFPELEAIKRGNLVATNDQCLRVQCCDGVGLKLRKP